MVIDHFKEKISFEIFHGLLKFSKSKKDQNFILKGLRISVKTISIVELESLNLDMIILKSLYMDTLFSLIESSSFLLSVKNLR